MEVLYERCCGLDVHKKSVVAHARITDAKGRLTRHTPTFGTLTVDLLALAAWLLRLEITALSDWRPASRQQLTIRLPRRAPRATRPQPT